MTELRTDRLELRRWTEADLDQHAALIADPEVNRYIGGPTGRDDAWRQIAIFMGHREMRGWTSSPLIERASGQVIGRAGLWRPEGWPGVEVGWVVKPSAWNQGYATEIGRAVRDHAFHQLGIDHVISVIGPNNLASIRVAEKIGSTFERVVEVRGTPQVIYGQRAPGA